LGVGVEADGAWSLVVEGFTLGRGRMPAARHLYYSIICLFRLERSVYRSWLRL
jgi:hypothetical protein